MSSAHGRTQSAACSEATTVLTRAIEVPDISIAGWLSIGEDPLVTFADRSGLQIGGWGTAATIEVEASDRFQQAKAASAGLFSDVDHTGPAVTRPRLIGGFAFQDDFTAADRWAGFAGGYFVLPAWMVIKDGATTWLAHTTVAEGPDRGAHKRRLRRQAERLQQNPPAVAGRLPAIAQTELTPDQQTWINTIQQTTDSIAAGDLQKVVLATRLTASLDRAIEPGALLAAFEQAYPQSYQFLIQPQSGQVFFGPTPERLLKVEGQTLMTEALAGSTPRGADPETDARYARQLRDSEKLQHEQQLVVDYLLDTLQTLGTAEAGRQQVKQLETIQHLHTPVQAHLSEQQHVLDCLEQIHPTPAVGGVPTARALEVIRDQESFARGWYAGPVGWVDAHGDGEFAVGIRSGLLNGNQLTLYAGNGIVGDSDPHDEWDEIDPKYQSLLSVFE